MMVASCFFSSKIPKLFQNFVLIHKSGARNFNLVCCWRMLGDSGLLEFSEGISKFLVFLVFFCFSFKKERGEEKLVLRKL